jgi:hypothetical protein
MMIGGFGLLIFRLYRIQIQDGPAYQKMALDQQLRATTISAKRAIFSTAT